ncbi:TonB-dependent receptor plug domain-containing protein [Saccharospirillum impatiens]|uniref:TonB-dependent receptor plug domain-containing protein n=1 Tax=Saccharospirillum impatiens TaxID=169438 RepID=UPI00041E245E|nr:TonB-dependent receptor [Saccharospirillum impatiens]
MVVAIRSPQATLFQHSRRTATGLALVLIGSWFPLLGWAEPVTLAPVVVTGTLSEVTAEDSPVAVRVIDRSTLESTQAVTLEDLLADIPGLQLKQTHGQTGSSILLNGLSEKHVLIMRDGVPLNQVNESRIDTRTLRLADIERIEVVSANASALYGSAAMGGVINLVSREPDRPEFEISVNARQYEAETERLPSQIDWAGRVAAPIPGGYSATTWSLTQDAGLDKTPDTWAEDLPNGLSWSLAQRFDLYAERDHRLAFNWSGSDLTRAGAHAVTGNPNRSSADEQKVSAQYQAIGERLDLIASAGYGWGVSEQDKLGSSGMDLRREYALWNTALEGRFQLSGDMHDAVLGARVSAAGLAQDKADLNAASEDEIAPVDQQSLELFAQDSWFATDRLELVGGLRGHWDEAYGVHWAPNLATRWDVTAYSYVRASLGLGYRVPDLKERYYQFDHSQLHGYRVTGNPDLEPETSVSGQLEWVVDPVSVELFYRDIEQLIVTAETDSDEPGVTVYQYQNIDRAEVYGINVSADHQLGAHQVSAHAQWLHAVSQATGDRLAQRPEYTLGLTHEWQLGIERPLRLRTQIAYTGPQFYGEQETQPVDPYTLVDVSASYQLTPAWSLTTAVNNLTDEISPTNGSSDGLPIGGRQYALGVQYRHPF